MGHCSFITARDVAAPVVGRLYYKKVKSCLTALSNFIMVCFNMSIVHVILGHVHSSSD